ncbi:hypothetical protein [Brevibacillus sp. SIMBA_076]|uniref:hypothetical protein n=1 Tax=Brevibacillus sp. SIMBA_076 TaxID=3085814 RepID=UPI00397C9141
MRIGRHRNLRSMVMVSLPIIHHSKDQDIHSLQVKDMGVVRVWIIDAADVQIIVGFAHQNVVEVVVDTNSYFLT